MTTVRIDISVPGYDAAFFTAPAPLIMVAEEAARNIRGQLPLGRATVSQVLIGDSTAYEADTLATSRVIKDGAAAGDVTVTGIATTDILQSVWKVHNIATDAGPPTISDLTAEFTITAVNKINNTGGTSSANDCLMVTYLRRTIV